MASTLNRLAPISVAAAALIALSTPAMAAEGTVIRDGRIGYALKTLFWSVHQTPDGKAECPEGFNTWGPRETFKAMFPQDKGQKWTIQESHLAREIEGWFPSDKPEKFPYLEAGGKIALGLNLDGKVDANDFTSPDGVKGVDNQLFRAIGCTRLFRAPDGTFANFTEMWVREMGFNRILVEITGVDNLANDDAVDVHLYRGKDKLITDATGKNIIPGGSNRTEDRFSKRFTKTLKGKIVDGVLQTEPMDVDWVWSVFFDHPGYYGIKQARIQLNLAPHGDRAEGMIAGYTDIDNFYQQLVRAWSTHHSSYGGMSQPSLFRALHRLADGAPNEKGVNTAISSSLNLNFVQVFIEHPAPKVAAVEGVQRAAVEPARR